MSAICPNGHESASDDYCDTCGSPIDASAQSGQSGKGGQSGQGAGGSGAPAGSPGAGAARSSLDLDPAGSAPASGDGPTTLECPNCHTANADAALFCEACGYDFTTGAMPRDPNAPAEPAEAPAPSDPAAPADPAAPSDPGAPPDPAASPAPSGQPSASSFEWIAEVWVDPDWYQTQEADDPCPSPGLPVIVALRDRSVLLGRASASRNTRPQIDLSSDPGVSRRHAQLTTDGTRWFVEDLGSSNGTFVGPASGPLPAAAVPVGPRTELGDDDRLYVGAWTRVVVRNATPDEVEAYA